MSFRITQNMMTQDLLSNLQTNYRALDKTQMQLSSGKKITKPSDDPVSAVRSMYYQTSLNEIDQYKKNVSDGTNWMQSTDSSLDEVNQVLQRVRELTVQAGSDTNNQSDRTAITDEITQLTQHLGEVANSEIAGRYIFAGTDTNTPPFDTSFQPPFTNTNQPFTNTNQQPISYEVAKGSSVQINVSGVSVFNNDGKGGVFTLLSNIVSEIKGGGNPADQLNNIDAQINNVLTSRADLGARMNRLSLSSSRLDSLQGSTEDLLSNETNVDIAQAMTNFSAQQSVYQSAMNAGAKIIQPSLLDFLK